MKEIPLSKGKVALVDDADFAQVSGYKWYAYNKGGWYATSGKVGSLHRFLMKPPREMVVDHKNGNGLDCRRENMRLATRSQNGMNRGKQQNNTSGFKGVRLHGGAQCKRPRYEALIKIDGIKYSLGCYDTPEAAARAYDAKAREAHGEFVRPNFPDCRVEGETK